MGKEVCVVQDEKEKRETSKAESRRGSTFFARHNHQQHSGKNASQMEKGKTRRF